MRNLKPLEAAIIYELDKNSSISLSKIAKKLKKTQQAIKYVVDKLKKEGIIKAFIPLVDYCKLGNYSLFIYGLKLQNVTSKMQQQILQKIATTEESCALLYSCSGMYDVLIGTIAKDVYEAKENFNKLFAPFKDKISKCDLYVITKHLTYSRFYLKNLVEKSNKLVFRDNSKIILASIQKNTNVFKLDELDFKLLYEISKDSSKKLLDLASALNTKPETIWNRKKNLEKNKIICSYTIVLDQFSYNHNFHIFKLTIDDEKTRQEVFDYLHKPPFVWKILETINPAEFLIFVVFSSKKEEEFLLNSIKDNFGEKIKFLEFLEVNKIYTFSYFPGGKYTP